MRFRRSQGFVSRGREGRLRVKFRVSVDRKDVKYGYFSNGCVDS